jgi:replication factor C subunit 3/5
MNSIFLDKYKPNKLIDISFNINISKLLIKLAQNSNIIPHLLLYGPSASGKKTKIYAFINEIYNTIITSKQVSNVILKHNKNISYKYFSNKYFIEITPSNYNQQDKYIISEFINNISKSKNIATQSFKIIIIHKADKLSFNAQTALRRIMETNINTVRFIFIANHINKIISPIVSRCLSIRNPSPSINDITCILKYIALKEKIILSKYNIDKIIENSSKINNLPNLINAINYIELSFNKNGKYITYNDGINLKFDSLFNIFKTINNINFFLPKIREIIFELYTNNIDLNLIFKFIVNKFNHDNTYSSNIKYNIIHAASDYQYRLVKSFNYGIIHVEAFLVYIFNIINI